MKDSTEVDRLRKQLSKEIKNKVDVIIKTKTTALDSKITENEGVIKELNGRVDNIKDSLKREVEKTEIKTNALVKTINTKTDALHAKIKKNEGTMEDLKARLGDVEEKTEIKTKALGVKIAENIKEVQQLNSRASKLEKDAYEGFKSLNEGFYNMARKFEKCCY